jgi:hypothetical protein
MYYDLRILQFQQRQVQHQRQGQYVRLDQLDFLTRIRINEIVVEARRVRTT